MVNFEAVIGDLVGVGFYEVVLVWLLFFAIFLGLLQKSRIIEDRQINTIISATIAFFIVLYSPGIVSQVQYYVSFFGSSAMVLSALLVIALFMAVLGLEWGTFWGEKGVIKREYLMAIILVVVVFITYSIMAGALGGGSPSLGISQETLNMLFFLGFILLVIWFATRGGQTSET